MYQIVPHTGDDSPDCITDMAASVRAVEKILNYQFKNKKLLEEALTHSSCPDSASYQRLEFVGDAALGLAITNFVYLAYPNLDPGDLSLLRSANISTEKFARVAVKHGLYKYVRHNAGILQNKVRDFVLAVEEEDGSVIYGGLIKAPKLLADIVESVAAAVYVDCSFDLRQLWVIFRSLLEPIVTPEVLHKQPQPVTMLFEVCQKDGKQVDFCHWRNGEKDIVSVYVDGQFVVSASSDQKDNAKLHAAQAALEKLAYSVKETVTMDFCTTINGNADIDGAKQKLHLLCGRKRWPKPIFRIEREVGPAHDKKYVCSVQMVIGDGVLNVAGDQKSRVKDAENSAAIFMMIGLQESKYI